MNGRLPLFSAIALSILAVSAPAFAEDTPFEELETAAVEPLVEVGQEFQCVVG